MNHEDGGVAMRSDLPIGVDGPMVPAVSRAASRLAADLRLDRASRIEVRIGRGLGELLGLEKSWRALLETLPQPSFIHTFEWQRAYLEHLGTEPEAVHYISLFDGGRAIAIFPLRRVRRSVGYLPMWMWELPTHPHLVLCDPLISPDRDPAVLLRLLMRTLSRRLELPWDALRLPNLTDDSIAVHGGAAKALPWAHRERSGCSMYFDCTDLEHALAHCHSNFSRNLRRQERKLAQRGAVTLTLARQGPELDAAFDDFLRLEVSGWKGAAGKVSAIALHPPLLGFYGDLKKRFAAADACLISLLKLDGQAIAAQFCVLAGGTLNVLKIAYDETWRAEAPGSQLLYRLIEHCCNEPGIRRLSLVTGPSWAVGRWNPQCLDVWTLQVFKPGLRGFCGLAVSHLKTRLLKPAKARWLKFRTARAEAGPQSNGG